MPQPAGPVPIFQKNQESSATPSQVKKARMLVSMLGADFAKTSAHPFFKDLARTAVRPLDKESVPPDMSKALANLVRRLAEPQRLTTVRVANDIAADCVTPSLDTSREQEADIMAQHPALIAKHLIDLPTAQRLDTLRKMKGRTARQVAIYISELRK